MYKKISLILATLATAGLLMAGCAPKTGDTKLREYIFEQLGKLPNPVFTTTAGEHYTDEITVIRGDKCLELTIKNRRTLNKLRLTDYGVKGSFLTYGSWRGVDAAKYNSRDVELEGMDEKFDEKLRILKPDLEKRIQRGEVS